MKIRTKAIAGVIVSVALAVVICVLIVLTTVNIHNVNEERHRAIGLTEDIIGLHTAALDYSLAPSNKIRDQLERACAKIGKDVDELAERFRGPDRNSILKKIRDATSAADGLVSKLGGGEAATDRSEVPLSDSDRSVIHQVWDESEEMLQGAQSVRDLTVQELTSAESSETILSIVFIAAIALVIGITLLTIGSITRPLLELDRGTRVIADGNLDYQVDVNRNDELGDLAGSFNKMALQLKDSFAELEAEVGERRRAQAALQEKNVELEGFAHTVSRDLKGPIAAIGFAAQTLNVLLARQIEDGTAFEVEEIARIIDGNVAKASGLIDEILMLAEAGQVPAEITGVDVKDVVDGILEENQWIMERKGIQVRVDELLGKVRANPTHLYQVFSNLLSNAIKYNDSTEPVIEVAYLGEEETGGQRYRVRDNGSGIPDDELDKVFIPFFKGRKGDTGIGLATVAKIVGVYDGEIRAYNDRGACFEFVIKDLR